MVHITEMRVPLPMTIQEFRRGQRFANWKTNESNTTEGQGGQLVSSAPYVSEIWGEGIFTHSLYRLGDRLPDWVTKLVPSSALVIDEKTWMAYPHIRSVLTVPFFHKLKIEMITVHENDDGSSENIFGLSEAELAIRKVDMVDIALDKVQKRDYQAKLDPQLFRSNRTGRGPLLSGWQKTSVPVMCAYKLVRVEANYWGVQNRVEKLMLNGVRQIILLTHRNAFCYIDEWHDLTFEQICAWELDGRQRLKSQVKHPAIIDPTTGLELVVEKGDDSSSRSTEHVNSEDSGTDLEFFEAPMEWATQEAEEFGETLMSGVSLSPVNWRSLATTNSCAVCEAKTKGPRLAEVVCQTCNEFFCQICFSEFHITPRLRDHVRHYMVFTGAKIKSQRICSREGSRRIMPEEQDDDRVSSSYRTTSNTSIKNGRPASIDDAQQVDKKVAHRRDLSWLEELNISFGDVPTTPIPRAKLKSKSKYRVLNSLRDNFSENGQESTSLHSARKKASVQPNELSEEMVRAISLLYHRYAESISPSSPPHNSGQCLPHVRKRSRSNSFVDLRSSEQQLDSLIGEFTFEPYGVQVSMGIGVYSNCVIASVTPDVDKLNDLDSYKHFRALAELLQNVDAQHMGHEQRLAFWINVYNSLMMHAYIVRGIPRSHYKRIRIMNKSAYIVGGHLISALAIEHAILRACSYRPALASILPVQKFKKHDTRQVYALDHPEPLVSFALCCGSHSSPMVRIYTAQNVQAELEEACRDFLSASVGLTPHLRIMIPKIMHWYARDFSSDAKSLLEWISLQLPEEKRGVVQECIEKKKGKKASQMMAVISYDWSFRYLFERITETQDSSVSSQFGEPR